MHAAAPARTPRRQPHLPQSLQCVELSLRFSFMYPLAKDQPSEASTELASCRLMRASAICSVTDDPPTLLVCMNRGSSAYASVTANGVLCVNVLSARHERLSRLFGGGTPVDERFAAAASSTLKTGAPVLADCAVAFDCRIIDVANVGTHDVLFCRVEALRRSGGSDNLIYFGRDYHVVRAGLA